MHDDILNNVIFILTVHTSFRDDDDICDATRSLAKGSLSVSYNQSPDGYHVVQLRLRFSCFCGPVAPVLQPALVVQSPRLARS